MKTPAKLLMPAKLLPGTVEPTPPSSGSASAIATGMALRNYGVAELTIAIDALALRGSRAHEGIHQARKAIRRTRAMLTLGQPVLGPGAHFVDRRLRRVNRRLSPLRDMQALVEAIDRLRTKARDEASTRALDRARRSATRRRGALSRKPEFIRQLQHEQAVLVMLRAALHGLPWECVPASMVIDAMTSAARKAGTARERAFARDRAEDWHTWRRRMRRISQQHRAAAATGLDAPVSRLLKKLTEQLGVMQDLSLLVAHCDTDSPFPKSSAQVRRFAERALARQRKRVRSVVAHL